MARMLRIVVSGHPLHIVQRGNNRQACFFCDEDRRFGGIPGTVTEIQSVNIRSRPLI